MGLTPKYIYIFTFSAVLGQNKKMDKDKQYVIDFFKATLTQIIMSGFIIKQRNNYIDDAAFMTMTGCQKGLSGNENYINNCQNTQ